MTVSQMAVAYEQAKVLVEQGCKSFVEAQQILQIAFGGNKNQRHGFSFCGAMRYQSCSFEKPESFELLMRQDAWRAIVNILELKKTSSLKRQKEIDDQLEDRNQSNLPPINEQTMMSMIEQNLNSMNDSLRELVMEIFNRLRPNDDSWISNKYKTVRSNSFAIQPRQLLVFMVERKYSGGGYRVIYGRAEDELRSLDNVMHILDGKPLPSTYGGPLCDSINQSQDGSGETDYFSFRCYKNKNLHLVFKRLDLLDELNRIGSGGLPQLKKV